MVFLCDKCKKEISLGDEWAGKQSRCPYCGSVVTVPLVTARPAESTPAEYHENPRPLMSDKRWLSCLVFIMIGIGIVLLVVAIGR
jgi:DNA-directed RNA polymerase subunit RPC12/RpoP